MKREMQKEFKHENETQNRVYLGEVISRKMDKTVVIRVARTFKHGTYGKIMRTFKKYKAHDENNSCRQGDLVEVKECRPLSKEKHMIVSRIVRTAA